MKQLFPRCSVPSLRSFNACVLSLLIFAAPIAPLAATTPESIKVASPITTSQIGTPPIQLTTREGLDDPPVKPLAALATVTATLADDIGLGAKKNPGDTITYTAVIGNTGTDATGVSYTHTLDANTTQTGTVNVSPVTLDDTYPQTVIGNISINSANIPFSVVSNDYQGQNGGALTISTFDPTTANGGQVSMTTSGAGIGQFTYNPPPGFEGTDTFTYTYSNSVGSSVGTVSIPVSGMVWFINNGAAGCTLVSAGCGRLSNPFSTLASFNTANGAADAGLVHNPAANDNIFIYESGTAYTGAVTLLSGQKLIGQDATASLAAITGLTPPSGSALFPAMNIGAPTTNVTNTVTVHNNSTVRGLSINVAGADKGLVSASRTGLSVSDIVAITSVNNTAVDFSSSSGTFTFNNISTSGSGAGLSFASTTSVSTVNVNNVSTSTGAAVTTSSTGATDFTVNDVTSTTGTAVDINVSTGDYIFHKITKIGGVTGIDVDSATGSFTVNGDSTTAGTGGTIQNTTSHGAKFIGSNNITLKNMNLTSNAQTQASSNINCGNNLVAGNTTLCTANLYLSSVTTISLTNLSITGSTQEGIAGTSVSGLTLANSTIENNGGEDYENGFLFKNLTGTCTISNSNIRNNFSKQGHIFNDGASALTLNVTGTLFGRTVAPGVSSQQGLLMELHGTSSTNVDIGTSAFNNNGNGNGFQINPASSATVGTVGTHSSIHNSTSMTNNAAHVFANTSGSSTMYFDTMNNAVMTAAHLQAIDYFANGGNLTGIIQGNTIGTNGVNQSGCNGANGCDGMTIDKALTGNLSLRIESNIIQQINTNGINLGGANSGGSINASIINNTIRQPSNSEPANSQGNAMLLNMGTVTPSAFTACLNVTGNLISDTAAKTWDINGSFAMIYVRARNTATVRIPGAAAGSAAAADTHITNNNTFTRVFVPNVEPVLTEAVGGGTYVNGAACSVPLLLADGGVDAISFLSALTDLASNASSDRHNLGTVSALNQAQLDGIVAAATQRWMATGLTPQQIAALSELRFELGDLAGSYLGEADGNRIVVDQDAQGKGWFVDATPTDDVEFGTKSSATRSYTNPFTSAAGRIDLLTAIEHEIGHKLGLTDSYAEKDRDSVMYGYLTVGERRLPAPGQAKYAQLNDNAGTHHLSLRSGLAVPPAKSDKPLAPLSGETIGPISIGTLNPGKSVTIVYQATVNSPPLVRQVSTQGTVSGSNFTLVNGVTTAAPNTDDPEAGGSPNPTVTNINTTITWTGATSTDWNTATNWQVPGPAVSTYAPGVSNPAVNDVVSPGGVLPNEPTISATDIGIYSLNISNGRTLTITNPRVLTIGGSPGGDLTLDGIISGGNLNLGTGTHVISNAGGTGSLSSTNVATVLSGSTVTLNNNLQAGALAVNAGGSMTIANRTLSLNGSGAALTIPGGATFTTTGSTVIFNGTAAQQAAGIGYNNLTINNSIGTNVTGVTLTGNASVNGAMALTSSDLDTGAFTLTQPNTTASTGVSDVVGTIARTGGPFALATPLTFGNPNNIITFTAGAQRPTTLTVVMAKTSPATYLAAVDRNYTISQTGTNDSTATVRLHYLESELGTNTPESALNLRRLRTSDNHWVAQVPGTVNEPSNYVESTTVAAANLPTQWTFSTLTPTATGSRITGRIVDDNGAPVEGAVVRLSGAQNRKFITDANGVYRFENVETGGFYNVTPSRVNYTFSPAVISFSQLGETTEAAFGATATGGSANPLDTPEYFVRQNYLDFLGREPDEAGFNFWSDQILGCGGDADCVDSKRAHVSAAYFLSIELQETGGLVDGLYRASYGRRPSHGEFKPDAAAVAPGLVVGPDGWATTLENGKATFIDAFVQRAAFRTAFDGLSASDYVDALISHTGVSFTAAERNALVSGLAGGMTRASVLRAIVEDADVVAAKRNEAFVMMEYFGYLRREPDAGGYLFWLDKLNQFNGNFEQAEMVRAFIVSQEYRSRFPR